ncbi:MAG TPA: hypothetical protein VK619_13020 [Pyrinomonadaceae bacterium]|nr:hypothetical protein [Pyrinomonadaceae bacterium]
MNEQPLADSQLWKEFQAAARRRRRNPTQLLTDYMRECLERWKDQKLDAEISRQAQASDYREADAMKIVHRHRHEKKRVRASS